MPVPQIQVQVEPLESGKVVYLPMAPVTSQAKARGRIMLLMTITNQMMSPTTVSQVTVSFPGSAVAASSLPINMTLGAGKSISWWFQNPADDIVFDLPGPGQVKLSFMCGGFSEPKEFTFGLAPHVSPVAGGAYHFPAKAADLALGEYWAMNGCTHGMGAQGSQSFAYDIGVWGINHDDGQYGDALPGTTGAKNEDRRIWGKPIYAMADGTVLEAVNDCPNNPAPLTWTDDADLAKKMKEQKDKYWGSHTGGGAGNHFYIQHGDEVVLYAHMQFGSLNPALLNKGAVVKAGDFLGKAGNAGNSTAPHLHIHAVQGSNPEQGPLRPFIWQGAWAIDNDLIISEPRKGFWSRIAKQGVPEGSPTQWFKGDVFFWPDASLPEWPEVVRLNVPETGYQAVFEEMTKNGLRPVWLDAHDLNGHTFFNLIFRPATGVTYVAQHGLDGAEYQTEFSKWTKAPNNFRLVHVESYYSNARKRICYAPIFVKSAGPGFTAYHGASEADHQSKLADFKNQGFVPVNISVVSSGGQRFFTGLYEKRDVGGSDVATAMSPDAFQQKFTANGQSGLRLAYINSYLHQGAINFVGIWHKQLPSPFVQHHLDVGEFDADQKAQHKANRFLRAVTGYQRGSVSNFAGIWNK